MNFITRKLSYVGLLILASTIASTSASANDLAGGLNDLACGPRAVRIVLNYYFGKSDDLIDLVKEIQWPRVEDGASVQAISESLIRRGVFVSAISLEPNSYVEWPNPIIVHLATSAGKVGHYAVLLPSADRAQRTVVDGIREPKELDRDAVPLDCSGVVLLTSTQPIRLADVSVYHIRRVPLLASLSLVALACTLSLVAYLKYRRKPWSLHGDRKLETLPEVCQVN